MFPSVFDLQRSRASLLLFQSSSAQSALPLFRHAVQTVNAPSILLVCLLYHPSKLVPTPADAVTILDWTRRVPGYHDGEIGVAEGLLKQLREGIVLVLSSVSLY